MKKNSRVYAAIHLDALEQNLENMKKNLTPGTRMIGVIKANAYGHGAVPVAHLMEGKDYIWGYAGGYQLAKGRGNHILSERRSAGFCGKWKCDRRNESDVWTGCSP